MKQIVLFTTVVLAVLLAFGVAWQLFSIVLLFLLSLAIAATLRAPIEFFVNRGIGRTLATSIVYIVALSGLLSLLLLIGSSLVNELGLMLTDLADVYTRLQVRWQSGQRLGSVVASRLPPPEQVAQWIADGHLNELMQIGMGATQYLAYSLGQLLLAIVLSIYWTADRLRFERLWLSLLPSQRRIHARNVWRALEDGVGAYTRSELLQSLLAGGLLTLGYWAMGLRYPFLWAFMASLAWLIPLIGSVVGLIPLALVTWMTVGPLDTAIVLLFTIVIFLLMEFVLEPRLYRYDRYQKVLVLLVMIALVDVYGLIGLLLAPFLATAIQLLLSEIATSIADQKKPTKFSQSMQADLLLLHKRLADIQQRTEEPIADSFDDTAMKRLRNLTERLSTLLHKTDHLRAVALHPAPSEEMVLEQNTEQAISKRRSNKEAD